MGSKPWNSVTRSIELVKVLTEIFGGGKRDRTADLLHAMQALSQLSYTPQNSRPSNAVTGDNQGYLQALAVSISEPRIIALNFGRTQPLQHGLPIAQLQHGVE